jgi:hypothetical protein
MKSNYTYFTLVLIVLSLIIYSCKKLENYDGNNQTFETTTFEYSEIMTLTVPNNLLPFQGIANCWNLQDPILGIPFTVPYDAFLPNSNDNPYTLLMYNVKPKSVELELVNIPNCDFGMLENITLYVCDTTVTDFNQFVLQDPANPYDSCNAVKLGEYLNIPETIGSKMFLTTNTEAILDQFVYAGDYQIYTTMIFDKAFTESDAIIKSNIIFEVSLINEE